MINNNITIHTASKELAVLIADLSRQTFYETFAKYNSKANLDKFMNEQFTKKALMDEVGAPNNIFLLAYHNSKVAGYARLREYNIHPGIGTIHALEIARLYAVSSMIGKGVGSALMKKSIEIAKEKNKKCVWLGVWQQNHRAISFYFRWGFEIFATHDFLLGDDVQKDWLMKKMI
jgi:ribosomal protein S18 acetylase RimI-like enzyme